MKRIIEEIVDDINGELAQETIAFSFKGTDYEIDLSKANADAMAKAFEPFIKNGRRTSEPPRKRPVRRDRSQTAAMREWANENGWSLGKTGRIPADAEAAWHKAHPTAA